ncbi:DUF2254 domain-containing protein [Pricia sp.]|uniref:DUF2254 domain-containing protein n=1 Tax=Pricia sp. TaxID=2268138 RepID=UPI003593D589
MFKFLPFIRRIYNSISFLTFCIAIGFSILAVSLVILQPDLLEEYPQLAIKNPENIKFILSFTIGGIFTLTIFTFTMVMNVLNRSISNYSPRLIPLILREKNQQVILGVTSGILIYALVMAVFISSENNIDFPPVAAPLAILMGAVSILLFIYFIHSVSQTIQVNYILHKSFLNTKRNLVELMDLKYTCVSRTSDIEWADKIAFEQCGYLNKIRLKKLISISAKIEVDFKLLKRMGSFVLENEPVLATSAKIGKKQLNKIKRCISIDRVEAIDVVEIGFKHLVEVAVKASSPAINDPGTALTAIDYLTQLFLIRKKIPEFNAMKSDKGGTLFFALVDVEKLASACFMEMEAYMADDPILMQKIEQSKEIIL